MGSVSKLGTVAHPFDESEDDRTDTEIDEQSPVFLEQRVAQGFRKVRHEQEVDCVPEQHRNERVADLRRHAS